MAVLRIVRNLLTLFLVTYVAASPLALQPRSKYNLLSWAVSLPNVSADTTAIEADYTMAVTTFGGKKCTGDNQGTSNMDHGTSLCINMSDAKSLHSESVFYGSCGGGCERYEIKYFKHFDW
jgi:hypothetical protein